MICGMSSRWAVAIIRPRPRMQSRAAQAAIASDAARTVFPEAPRPGLEAASFKRLADLAHQVQVVGQVMDAREHRPEHLAAAIEVMQVGPRKAGAGVAGAGRIERALVGAV